MQKSVCILDLSASEIQIILLVDNQLQDISLRLPWEVGFRQENDGKLTSCFGENLHRLDPNHPEEVKFIDLDSVLKRIIDEKTLECLFNAILEEIFYRRLPNLGYPIDSMSVFAITPYHWKPIHRQQLRKAIKHLKCDAPVSFLKPSKVTLRGLLSQTLCLSVCYYQKLLMELPVGASKCYLLLVDFAPNGLIVCHTICSQLEEHAVIELTDMLQFSDINTDIRVSNLQETLEEAENSLPVVVGFSGTLDDTAQKSIELLKRQCGATFLDLQGNAAIFGAVELVRQCDEKNLGKPIHFVYRYCFGIELPDGKKIELVPNTWIPPYHCKKAFRFIGEAKTFDVHLLCGLSMTRNSDVLHLASLKISPWENKKFTRNSPMEFVLSVTLNETTSGTFTLHLPFPQETKSVEFNVPVLMD